MRKVVLLVKKYCYFVAIPIVYAVYLMLFRRDPRNPPAELVGEKPPPEKPPEEVVTTNFVNKLIEKKRENDEKIDKLTRRELIDSINSDYE